MNNSSFQSPPRTTSGSGKGHHVVKSPSTSSSTHSHSSSHHTTGISPSHYHSPMSYSTPVRLPTSYYSSHGNSPINITASPSSSSPSINKQYFPNLQFASPLQTNISNTNLPMIPFMQNDYQRGICRIEWYDVIKRVYIHLGSGFLCGSHKRIVTTSLVLSATISTSLCRVIFPHLNQLTVAISGVAPIVGGLNFADMKEFPCHTTSSSSWGYQHPANPFGPRDVFSCELTEEVQDGYVFQPMEFSDDDIPRPMVLQFASHIFLCDHLIDQLTPLAWNPLTFLATLIPPLQGDYSSGAPIYDIQGRVFGISLVNAHGKCVILHIQRFVDLQLAVEKKKLPATFTSSSSSSVLLTEGKESSPTTTPRNTTMH